MNNEEAKDELPEEDRAQVGYEPGLLTIQGSSSKKNFAAWHHPVKQIVREMQWAELTRKLIEDRQLANATLRYFTLPGPDLFDIKVLSEVCSESENKIEYFGFLGGDPSKDTDDRASWAVAEAALRQSGKISDTSEIVSDRIEDIAIHNSKARSSLESRPIFDIINIDACDYLAYKPLKREACTFDAMLALLEHQTKATAPWLLFLTTRADANQLGVPGGFLQQAVLENYISWPAFGAELASEMNWGADTILASINVAWNSSGMSFMEIFTLGVSKFLLRHFHRARHVQADVKLKSSFVYRVHGSDVDMAALAFLVSPDPPAPPVRVGGEEEPEQNPEIDRARRVVRRLKSVWNIDDAIQTDVGLLSQAVSGTENLLITANYDLGQWREWVSNHAVRPLPIGNL